MEEDLKYYVTEIVMGVVTIVYLLKLRAFNKILNGELTHNLVSDAFGHVNDQSMWQYFGGGILLIAGLVVISIWSLHARHSGINIPGIINTMVNLVFIILVIAFLTNPIMKIVLAVSTIGGIVCLAYASQD